MRMSIHVKSSRMIEITSGLPKQQVCYDTVIVLSSRNQSKNLK